MSSYRSSFRTLAALTAGVGLSLVMTACSGSPETDADAPKAQSYESRGIVRQLAAPPGQEMQIHHEAIPTFVDMDGEVVGMGSMSMPFPVADTELPADLQAGDKVSFTFEVSWTGSPPMRLLSLEKLPADTVLSFETTETGGSEAPAEGHEGHEAGADTSETPAAEPEAGADHDPHAAREDG